MDQITSCLIGNPVSHSISDIMFEHFGRYFNMNYKHLKFSVQKNNLKAAMDGLRAFGICGANITLPYKTEVIRYLDELDPISTKIGAVNTVTSSGARLRGYNTDCYGAMAAIDNHLKMVTKKDTAVIFGAGGAARAIAYGLLQKAGGVVIFNRRADSKQSLKLQQDFRNIGNGVVVLPLQKDDSLINELVSANYIINATSVGMVPKSRDSIISDSDLRRVDKRVNVSTKYFFDAVFNPYTTRFLSLGNEYGAATCPGIYMMIYQGLLAFRLWTGKKVPESMVESMANELKTVLT
jgi:shikimate dehydrogenase